jgi:dienelactone hydrolase
MTEMIQRYPIDEDRIILAGISMGGMGVWTIGAHHPDLFAGLLILAGRGDYYYWQNVNRDDLPAYKQRLIDTEFAASLLPNLKNISIFCAHGAKDPLVPVEEARHIVKAAMAAKLNIAYTELEGASHWIFEDMFGRKATRDWMKKRRRTTPSEFTYRTYHPKYNRCHWITGMDVLRTAAPAEVTARVANGEIVIEARGIRSLVVERDRMPRRLRGRPIVKQGRFDIVIRETSSPPAAAPAW